MRAIYDEWKGHYVWHVNYGDEQERVLRFIKTMYSLGLLKEYNFNYVNKNYVVAWWT